MRTSIAIVHIDLAVESADRHYEAVASRVSPGQGVRLVFWRHDLPLGEVQLTAEAWPVTRPRFRQLIAQAIAPAVGQRLFGTGFDPALPSADRPESLRQHRPRARCPGWPVRWKALRYQQRPSRPTAHRECP